jgi:LytS/YehU family sensor histidine kinase
LQSVRSQLNPHFVYNALAGIQNLLNKKENDAANSYLTKFSRLSRRVLDDADKDLIPLNEEIGMLDDYLQMEQFRFGFVYTITVDQDIDAHNAEIPTMLVQPFVENAVKHGIVSLKEGRVSIRFEKAGKSIVVMVEDNGVGFDTGVRTNGAGLSLSKNRISLLNEVYRSTPVSLQVTSGEIGTKVIITLNDWLA